MRAMYKRTGALNAVENLAELDLRQIPCILGFLPSPQYHFLKNHALSLAPIFRYYPMSLNAVIHSNGVVPVYQREEGGECIDRNTTF